MAWPNVTVAGVDSSRVTVAAGLSESAVAQIVATPVVFRAHAVQKLIVSPVTLPSGRVLTDWASFLLTWREDPYWPRSGFREVRGLDPYDTWDSVLSLSLVAATAIVGATLELPLTTTLTDLAAGEKRYAFDVRGVGGTAGEIPLIDCRWINLLPRVG